MDKIKAMTELLNKYSSCVTCAELTLHRTNVIFGTGNVNADLMIVGEAPGEEEDRSGFPIAASAGGLLESTLAAAGVASKDVYITNMVLCRPVSIEQGKRGPYKKNREPLRGELEACYDRLCQEIYIVDPKLILLLGPRATSLVTHLSMQNVIGTFQRVKIPGKTAKTVLSYPAIATYHPSYILRTGEEQTPGSYASIFNDHVHLAARMLRVAREMSQTN